ncbi:hypothetical protein B0J17DRAFT_767615 [Rhizoctonia solani]|nr:hypothetical protein B0J17DRAFT_767615 [Rhizoctonia solani]
MVGVVLVTPSPASSPVAKFPFMPPQAPPNDSYEGRTSALGRDDPVWPCYVTESTKHDANMVDAWNKNMDVLLGGTLLGGGYSSLKPDVAYITAASVSRLVELQTPNRQPSNTTILIPSLDGFQPASSDLMINAMWFCSLALGMTVALITMLVKQWSERYLHGRYFTVGPYYIQARTRQARYNNLDRSVLKMRYVIQALQIMMHIALGLFLSGLIVLLKNSKQTAWLWTLVAVPTFLAFLFYLYITIMPLVVAFCPCHAPFSSRRLSNKFVALILRFVRIAFWTVDKALEYEIGLRALPSGQEWSKRSAPRDEVEWKISTSVAPDKLTAQAIVWLISYSQDSPSVDAAIRAIAGTVAGPELWNDLVQPEPVALIVQRFTSFFQGTLEQSNNLVLNFDDSDLMQVASSSGLCGASAWWTSMGRKPYRCTEEYGPLLPRLIAFLQVRSTRISGSLLVALVEALAFEVSYMSRELRDEEMADVFHSVLRLCSDGSVVLKGPARSMMAATLAVVAMLLSDYPSVDPPKSKSKDKLSIPAQYKKTWKIFKEKYPLDVDENSNPRPPHLRQWRAAWIADVCTKNPKYLEEHSDALLFFGLGGILCSLLEPNHPITFCYSALDSQSYIQHQVLVAEGIISAFRTRPPDPIAQTAFEKTKSELLRALSTDGHWIEFRSDLLVGILQIFETTNHGLLQARCLIALDRYWFLHSTSGLNIYNLPSWRLFVESRLINIWVEIFHHVDDLAQDMSQEERDRLRRSTIACFAKLARTIKIQEKPSPPPAPSQLNPSTTANRTPRQMITNPSPNPGQHTNPGPPQEILNSLEQLLLNNAGLFDVFARDIACGTNPEVDQVNLDFWRNAILCLPGRLAANPTAQTSAGQQAPTNSVLPSPAASASSQVLPTSIGPHASNIPVQTPVASGSQPIAGSSYLQVPIVHTGPQASPSPSGATTASTLKSSALRVPQALIRKLLRVPVHRPLCPLLKFLP